MLQYREKRKTTIDGVVTHAIVSVIFYHGYAGCGPYARVTFPDGGEYSIDQETLGRYFDQVPDQTIVVGLVQPGPYDRTQHVEPDSEEA